MYCCFGCKLQRKYPMLLYNWVLNYKKCNDVDLLKIDMSIKMNDKIYIQVSSLVVNTIHI